MEELRSIMGRKRYENGIMHYVVSDLNPRTGEQMRVGQKVIVSSNTTHCNKCDAEYCDHIDTLQELRNILGTELMDEIVNNLHWIEIAAESFSCSCADFRNTQNECIHILSVKNLEKDIRTKPREELNAQKAEEVEVLRRRIEELESERNLYRGEKESRDKEIQNLKLELADKEYTAKEINIQKSEEIEDLGSKIDELESKRDRDIGEKESRDKEIQNLKLELEHKESEVQQINKIMEEKEAERQKAASIAEMLSKKRFASLYNLPKEIQSYILGLAELEPEKIMEAVIPVVGPAIYQKIPRSQRECRDKVIWGKREHHRPRRFEEFAQKIAEIDTIDQITVSRDVRTNDTRIKGIYEPGRNLPYRQKNDGWTIHMVYSGSDFGVNLYLHTMARDDSEAELIRREVERKI